MKTTPQTTRDAAPSAAISRGLLQQSATSDDLDAIRAAGATILNYPSGWSIERRARRAANELQLTGFSEIHGAACALHAIETARDTVAAMERDRRIANVPLRRILERDPDAVERIMADPDGDALTSEGLRRALGLVRVPASASRIWGGGHRMGISMRVAEQIAGTLGIDSWQIEELSDEYLATWSPQPAAVAVVEQHGWAATDQRPAMPTQRACSLALRAIGVDRFEEEQTINRARRAHGRHQLEFATNDLTAARRRAARWLAFSDGLVTSSLRRRQIGSTVTLGRVADGDLVGRRLVRGWEVSLQHPGIGRGSMLVEQLAAHEPKAAAQAVADDFAQHA